MGKYDEGAKLLKSGYGALSKLVERFDKLRSGGARELTESEKIAQYVLDLLKSGRADEVTDEMLSAADDAYLYKNYDLPMDNASRLARADEMGAGDTFYHGTDKDFSEFKNNNKRGYQGEGIYAAERPSQTDRFLKKTIEEKFSEGSNVMPIKFLGETYKNPLDLESVSREEAIAILKRFKLSPNKYYTHEGTNIPDYDSQIYDLASREANKLYGRNALTQEWMEEVYKNLNRRIEKAGYTSKADDYTGYKMAFKPKNVRSEYARFDPRLKDSKNLLAAVAPVATAGALSQIKGRPE